MRADKRLSARHEVALSARISVDDASYDSQIANLSLGGALIQLGEHLPMNQPVQVSFSIPTQKEPIEIRALVRWSTGSEIGVQFDGLRAREVWSLTRYFELLA